MNEFTKGLLSSYGIHYTIIHSEILNNNLLLEEADILIEEENNH